MDPLQEAKNLIDQSKNIYILPSEENEENITSALALFYTLKELNKNVNLIIDEIPEKLRFLTPSLDHISYPRNFIISIPSASAEVSQVRYEKDEKDLKIYLTIDKGNIKKGDISFSFTEPKADLLITIGKKEPDNKNRLENSVLENSPILNIDNQKENKNFGKVNLLEPESFLTELIYNLIWSIDEEIIKKNIATALLAGLILSSDNFRDEKTSSRILEIAAFLVKKEASHQEIVNNLFPRTKKPCPECG